MIEVDALSREQEGTSTGEAESNVEPAGATGTDEATEIENVAPSKE